MYKIFIIEDDVVIRTELVTLLNKYGYLALTIETFDDVVNQALVTEPHLILLDINLPMFDGYFICREIRKRSKVPIVVVTSRDSDTDELMSMNLGADDFITKPYHTQILLARIAALLSRCYQVDSKETLTFGELTLDISKSNVLFNGKQTELTKNEQRILAQLMKNQGGITNRSDIMNELWQSDEFIDDNTLTVNINRLRKKLEEIGAIDKLKTHRGLGYSLCE